MRLIDADATIKTYCKNSCMKGADNATVPCAVPCEEVQAMLNAPTIVAPRWHRVEDDPPDKKEDAIFYYEWTGISGTVYKETSITSLDELMALGCRPIAWMEKPEPPKEIMNE